MSERVLVAIFDGMAWPIPDHKAGYAIRYQQNPDDHVRLRAAWEMDCYARLIAMPKRKRDKVIAGIRNSLKS